MGLQETHLDEMRTSWEEAGTPATFANHRRVNLHAGKVHAEAFPFNHLFPAARGRILQELLSSKIEVQVSLAKQSHYPSFLLPSFLLSLTPLASRPGSVGNRPTMRRGRLTDDLPHAFCGMTCPLQGFMPPLRGSIKTKARFET